MTTDAARTYLVTGAAGFIGSHLVDALLRLGHRVIGIDNFDSFYARERKRRNIRGALDHERYELLEGDIRDSGFLDDALRGSEVSAVFHLAARAGVRASIADPAQYQSVNILGTQCLLDAMARAGVTRLIFASSSSVYGNAAQIPFRESDVADRPVSPYAATKRAGELLCYTYHHLYGFDVACLRFFTVYGPRQRPDMAIHKFTRLLFNGEPVPMFGDGRTARDYTFVDDAVAGIIAIERAFAGYHIVNIGGSRTTTLIELIELIASTVGVRPAIESMESQQGDVDLTYADISVARSFGYDPATPMARGIGTFVDWYREELHAETPDAASVSAQASAGTINEPS